MIGSSVLVEEVFARPGLGKLMVGATKQKDYTALQSVMVVYTLFVIFPAVEASVPEEELWLMNMRLSDR